MASITETQTTIVEMRLEVHEAADSDRGKPTPLLEVRRLSPDQRSSDVVRVFNELTVHKNMRNKDVSLAFEIHNACFPETGAERGDGKYSYPVMKFIHEAPTILVKRNQDGHSLMIQGMLHCFGQGKLFIIGQGEVSASVSLISPGWNPRSMSLNGHPLLRDEERGLALYSAPHGLTICLEMGVPLDQTRLYSLKGSFAFQTSLISSARGSAWYPFDTYQFAGEVRFPFERTFLVPTILSDLNPAEGLAIRLPRAPIPSTIPVGEAWHLNMLFGRRAKAWQFVGALMVLVLASAMIHFNAALGTIARITVHALAIAIFLWWTQPAVPGVPFLYPTRMVPASIIVIALAMAECSR